MISSISNLKGNINSIHSYNRHRAREEDKLVFGKLMGIGTISCSIGIIVFGLLSLLAEMLYKAVLITIGSYINIAGLAAGVIVVTYASFKYNRVLF